jgi:phage-related protein
MEYENGRESLDEHLLARLGAGQTELNRLQVRDAFERVFYCVHRIVLLECFYVSHQEICAG